MLNIVDCGSYQNKCYTIDDTKKRYFTKKITLSKLDGDYPSKLKMSLNHYKTACSSVNLIYTQNFTLILSNPQIMNDNYIQYTIQSCEGLYYFYSTEPSSLSLFDFDYSCSLSIHQRYNFHQLDCLKGNENVNLYKEIYNILNSLSVYPPFFSESSLSYLSNSGCIISNSESNYLWTTLLSILAFMIGLIISYLLLFGIANCIRFLMNRVERHS
ncbi:hypothetical protein WA158_005246 [Blastocystis sp. Blastoise]